MHEEHVLAALSRALDPALAERVGEVVERLREGMPETFDATEGYAPSVSLAEERMADAADLITALLTQNAALRAERDDAVIKRAAWELEAKTQQSRAEAAEAVAEKLRGAMIQMRDDKTGFRHAVHFRRFITAALTETATTEERNG